MLALSSILADLPAPPKSLEHDSILWIAGGVGAFLFLLLIYFLSRRGGRRRAPDPQEKLRENLGEYPSPPPASDLRLWVYNEPVRVRLVVIAPTGKRLIGSDNPEELLDNVVRGLTGIVKADKARIRVWPAQLSIQGFSHTFGRLTSIPEPAESPTRWQLISGPMKFGKHQILVGMAVLAEKAYERRPMTPQPHQWMEWLRVAPPHR